MKRFRAPNILMMSGCGGVDGVKAVLLMLEDIWRFGMLMLMGLAPIGGSR